MFFFSFSELIVQVVNLIFLDDAVLMFCRRRVPGDADRCTVLIAHCENRHLLRRSTGRWRYGERNRKTETFTSMTFMMFFYTIGILDFPEKQI